MSSPVRSEAGRWHGFVALFTACSFACGPIYPPPRIRVATPTAASPPAASDLEDGNDPSCVNDPEEEAETTDDTDAAEETEATDSDAPDDAEPTSAALPPCPPATPAPAQAPTPASALLTNATGIVRYRLPIRDNPVDPAQALRCYSGCRQAPTEAVYLECLSQCPGFAVEPGFTCGPGEGIPNSVCVVRLPPGRREESTPGAVVAAVVLGVAMLFGLASLCNASPSQCGLGYGYRPYRY